MLMHRLTPGDTTQAYSNFKITFWIDRFLLWTTVFAPLVAASLLILLQAIVDISKCNLSKDTSAEQGDYLNRFCSLQLANNILHGEQINRPKDERGSLQQEYYPFLLLISAFLLWLPHAMFNKAVCRVGRRNLIMVRNELQNFRENTMRELNRRGHDSEINLVDFSASVSELPHLHSCQVDWSLSHYLSSWQKTDFFWRRYFTKHLIILILQTIVFIAVFSVLCVHSGAPFAPRFVCFLTKSMNMGKETDCVLQSTFMVNISVVVLYLCNIGSLLTQLGFFYYHFCQTRYSFREDRYFDECFFGSYIRLIAYSLFREVQKVHEVHINLSPGFLRTDFHYMSMLCAENQALLTDIFFVHYWTERFLRANRKRQYIHSGSVTRLRRGSFGFLRSEDVSEKLNFTKMKLKVELNDLFW